MTLALAVIVTAFIAVGACWLVTLHERHRWLPPASLYTILGIALVVIVGGGVRVAVADDNTERRRGAALAVGVAALSGVAVLWTETRAQK